MFFETKKIYLYWCLRYLILKFFFNLNFKTLKQIKVAWLFENVTTKFGEIRLAPSKTYFKNMERFYNYLKTEKYSSQEIFFDGRDTIK